MKVLVTGATGFIGSEIVKKLVENNIEILGMAGNSEVKISGVETISRDITKSLDTEVFNHRGQFDAVIHCAGLAHQFGNINNEKFIQVNVDGTKHISELAVELRIKHFILISSTAVYGSYNIAMNEAVECFPETDYAKSKLDAENVCREICEKNEIPITIFRLASVLGEKGIGNIPRLINAIYKSRFFWIGKGHNKKSLIYVEDVARACLKLLESKKDGTEIFNLAAEPIEMSDLVKIIAENLHKQIPKVSLSPNIPRLIFNVNDSLLKITLIKRLSIIFEKWLSDDVYPADKIQSKYGFVPETKIEEAVKKQCRWFLEQENK